jgi:predicted nucleic acid-binding protein
MPTAPPLWDTPLAMDTVILTHLRNRHEYVQREIDDYFSRKKEVPALTAFTIFEAVKGVEEQIAIGKITEERARHYISVIETLTQTYEVLPFNHQAAVIAAYIQPRIFSTLSKKEREKLWGDLFITATALAHGYGIATQNQKDFEKIADYLPPQNNLLRIALWKP